MTRDRFRLSVGVPLYNEEEVFATFHRRLFAVLDALPGGPHEVIYVDDGSSDGTARLLRQAAAADPRVTAVLLSRNFGHQAALTAALDHVTGDATVVMDGDLQDTPETIPELVARWREGYDVVYVRRVDRKEPKWLRFSYFLFYRVAAGLSEIRLPVDVGDFGLMSGRVVRLLRSMPEKNRYLRGLRAWAGFRQIGISVERAPRAAGSTKYSVRRLLELAFDGIFSFSVAPLRAVSLLGLAAILLSSLFAVYSLWARFFMARTPQGFTALIFALTFLSGVQLLSLGIIGEYIGRLYSEAKGRPLYVIADVLGGASTQAESSLNRLGGATRSEVVLQVAPDTVAREGSPAEPTAS